MGIFLAFLLAQSAQAFDVACLAQRPDTQACETGRITIPESATDIHGECVSGSLAWNVWSSPEADGSTTIGFLAIDASGSCSLSYLHPAEKLAEMQCLSPNGKAFTLRCETLP